MYTLRDYQAEAVAIAIDHLHTYGSPFIIQAATGAGKSLIIADICHKIDEPILILQPSKEILEQNHAKLISYDPLIDATIYSASAGQKNIGKFTFATIGSIYKKADLFSHFKYVIIDECHGIDPKNIDGMLTSFLRAIDCHNVCGLTATPYRIAIKWTRLPWGDLESSASLKMINRIGKTPFFKKIAYKIETQELIDRGYLSPIKYYKDDVDWSKLELKNNSSNFTDASLKKFWSQKRLSRIASAVAYSETNNKRTLVFCVSIEQAENALAMVRNRGIVASIVTGTTPKKEREEIIDKFRRGNIKHLFNVGVFTTGFDSPVLDCIVLARPTMSLALYYQMVGRGVRLDPNDSGKVLQVYDLAGIVARLGRVETIRVQSEATSKPFKRDEVWSERGRMDDTELYSSIVPPKIKEEITV